MGIHTWNIWPENRTKIEFSVCDDTFKLWYFINVIPFTALEGKLYTQIARMISVCVIHGGVAPNFFSDRLFNQICGKPSLPATLEEVGDFTFQEKLLEVSPKLCVQE